MYPQNKNPPLKWKSAVWKPKKQTVQQRASAFRPGGSNIGRPIFNETKFLNKCRKNPPIGMFANARSSLPFSSANSSFQNSSMYEEEDLIPPPLKITKFSKNIPDRNTGNGWDFSDISIGKDELEGKKVSESGKLQIPPCIPSLKKYTSEDEKQPESSSNLRTEKKKTVPPWLKKWNSEDEKQPEKPKKLEKIDESGLLKIVDNFSERLENSSFLTPIPLQNHTKTMLGTVEKAVMVVALAQKDCETRTKSVPVFDLLLERSDRLIYRKELNDETNYEPDDPFYDSDIISSEYEAYEQEKERLNIPTYLRKTDSEDENGEDSDSQTIDKNAGFREDSPEGTFPEKADKIHEAKEDFFNVFSKNQTKSSSSQQKITKIAESKKSKTSSTLFLNFGDKEVVQQKKSNPSVQSGSDLKTSSKLPTIPQEPSSSNYSPFNFSFCSESPPPKSTTAPSSKFSFW